MLTAYAIQLGFRKRRRPLLLKVLRPRKSNSIAWRRRSTILISIQVDTTKKIPVRALTLVTAVVCLLSLINIGSTVAFNAVLSLSTWALYISYIIPITLLVIKRIRQEKVDFGPFRVRRFGLLVNLYALVYGVFICIFLPFPPDLPVNASNFNYASPVFGGVIILAVAAWFLGGRKVFVGPKREVENTDTVAST